MRTAILRECSQALLENKTELATLLAREMGKPIVQAEIEVEDAAHKFSGYAEKANHDFILINIKPLCLNKHNGRRLI